MSVIIPVYNRALAVQRAISSVLTQTHQNVELIVVDDASTDGTASVVTAIPDDRIRLIRHDRNRGGSAARNTGIAAGTAPFVAFLDSDDEWLPMKLERQLEVFARSSVRLGLVYTGAERIYADGAVDRRIPRQHRDLIRALLRKNVVGETSVGMVPRHALTAIGGFDESLPSMQDMDLWVRLCERFSADFVPEALVRVNKGDDRGRISADVARTIRGREVFCEKHRPSLRRKGVLHLYLRESGWWQQRRAANPQLARHFYRQAIAVRPLAPLTYLLLVLACLPTSLLDGLARVKRSGTSVAKRVRAWRSPARTYSDPSRVKARK